jgi:hypothetical protein
LGNRSHLESLAYFAVDFPTDAARNGIQNWNLRPASAFNDRSTGSPQPDARHALATVDDYRQVIELRRAMRRAVLFKAHEKCYLCNRFVAELGEGK